MTATAQKQLFQKHLTPVLNSAYRAAYYLTQHQGEAEKLVEEAVVRGFRSFDTFQPGANFRAWFLQIITHLSRNRCHQRQQQPELARWEAAADVWLAASAGEHARLAAEAEAFGHPGYRLDRQQIADTFALLPEEYRSVCVLYFMEEFSCQEIAAVVGCPVETVRSRLHRGRVWLQQALYKLGIERGWEQESLPHRGVREDNRAQEAAPSLALMPAGC